MNQKKRYRPEPGEKNPEYHRSFGIASGGKTYQVTSGTLVSVIRKPGLLAGKWEILYGEWANGVLLIHVEGPQSRIVSERRRKIIRQSDIKTVHVKSIRRE